MRSASRNRFVDVGVALALIVVLGGAAFAASALPARSVGTAQLKDGAVTTLKIKNGSLLRKDFKAGQLKSTTIKTFGPVKMNVDDPVKRVLTLPAIALEADCRRVANAPGTPDDDTISASVQLVARKAHVSYQSEADYDEDLNPGEGANWYSESTTTLVDGPADPPVMQTATAILPGGNQGVFARTTFMANKGSHDCTFFGQLDLV